MRRVVHEIRNHLAVAVANVEAFRDGVLAPTPQRLGAVLQALDEIAALLGDVSTAAQPAFSADRRMFDVCEIITNEVLAFEAAAAARGIDFVVHQCAAHAPGCAHYCGDPTRVAEIVNNIIGNAVRYTPPGGRIEVDCRRAGGRLAFSVTDTGPGVAPRERERIFEPGVRGEAAASTAGSGVGLALVKRFVLEQGGTVVAEDGPGGGARFVVTLPDTQPRDHDAPTISLL